MYRADACQTSARVYVAHAIVQHPEDELQRQVAEKAGFDITEGTELVGHVVIFDVRQRRDMDRIRTRRDHRISLFEPPQLPYEQRRIDQNEWRQQEQRQWQQDEVGNISEPPADRSRGGWRQCRPMLVVIFNEPIAYGPRRQLLERCHLLLENSLQSMMQFLFLADLYDCTSDPVHVLRSRPRRIGLHPLQQIRIRRIVGAAAEYLTKADARSEER